jgi:hypothetical protein
VNLKSYEMTTWQSKHNNNGNVDYDVNLEASCFNFAGAVDSTGGTAM